MKVVQKTSRLLKLKQTNWMPWYGHLLLWPTVSLLLLMSLGGQSSKLTCSRASGQCQLKNELSNKTIPIDTVTKVDVVATDQTTEEPDAQIVLITKDAEMNLGLVGEFAARDEAAGKLAWFFEDTSSKFIELTESNKPWANGSGLTGLAAILGAFLLRKTSVASFDRDTERCTVQLSRFFGLIKGRREVCELSDIQNIDFSGSLKVADDRILVHQSAKASFFLTDYASRDLRNELVSIDSIKEFLGLSLPQSQSSDIFAAENESVDNNSAYYSSSSEEYTTTESYSSEPYRSEPSSSISDSASSSDSSSTDSSSSND